jgi:hypothetical protein
VADHAHIASGDRQLRAHLVRLLIGEEGEHHHRALAFGERFQASGEAIGIERQRLRRLERLGRVAPCLEQRLAPPCPTPQLEHRHAAGVEHEGCDSLRVAHFPDAQALERHEEHLLHEVRRRMPVAQVA